jgi:adenylate cyclase
LRLKNKKVLRNLIGSAGISVALICSVIALFDLTWNTLDYKANDVFYRKIIDNGKGVKVSDRIAYVTISDKTYDSLKSNILSRKLLADLNNSLAEFAPASVMYDIVFARPNSADADSLFAQSLANLGVVYLPAGFDLVTNDCRFRWEDGLFYQRLRNEFLKKPIISGNGTPYSARRCLPQLGAFIQNACNSGHITTMTDPDGLTRHFSMLVKVDSLFIPTVSLSMFLDYVKVPFDSVRVKWGDEIVIPALKESYLEHDVAIPIDKNGRTFVPFPYKWENIPKMMEIQNVIEYAKDGHYTEELSRIFGGSFVFVGDVSVGISDLGQTSVETNVPLVEVHAALLNAMLGNQFYTEEKSSLVLLTIVLGSLLLLLCSFTRSNAPLYLVNCILVIAIILFSYYHILHFRLFPFVTVAIAIELVFGALVGTMQVSLSREQYFIKNAFSKYVPARVVERLLANPEELKLGGDERFLTIVFTDIAGFTRIAESLTPTKLVPYLNQYLTEMTDIVLAHGGIIDKYLGDGIIAEFGAPLPQQNHADEAVRTGLEMLRKLETLGAEWESKGLPRLTCRVGINSGEVIVGNMGSAQVFDYTVIGDAVNLASRLESVNKKYATHFIISESTADLLTAGLFRTQLLDFVKVKGKQHPVKIYEVVGYADDSISEDRANYYKNYTRGFEYYLQRNFTKAIEAYQLALQNRPDDSAAIGMIKRSSDLLKTPPDANWDGSVELTEK